MLSLIDEFGLEVETQEVSLSSLIYDQGQYYCFQSELARFLTQNPTLLNTLPHLASTFTSMQELLNHIFRDEPLLLMAFTSRLSTYEGVHVSKQSNLSQY